jgi:hypothetical protein
MKRLTKRPLRFWVALGFLLLVGALLIPSLRWKAIGWARGEAFYECLPTSYWRDECERWDGHFDGGTMGSVKMLPSAPFPVVWVRRPPTWWERLFGSRATSEDEPLLHRGDRQAIPVLVALLKDENDKVRHFAATGLKNVGSDALPALQAVLRELQQLESDARNTKWMIDPKAKERDAEP